MGCLLYTSDVYKRQVSEESDAPQQLMLVSIHNSLGAPQEQLYAFQPWAPLIVELPPVSYTHLDVYKRQHYYRVSGYIL